MIDLARTLSDTFAGIAPSSVPMFALMQLLGGAAGIAVVAVLHPTVAAGADAVVVPHEAPASAEAEGPTPPPRRRFR